MTQDDFQECISKYANNLQLIKEGAHVLHAGVNQLYDQNLPYGFHLDMVADSVYKYGYLVCVNEADVLPLFFGAYYHDSIEDARLTYNDAKKIATGLMNKDQAFTAVEIVYALTNDKGRTREERAGEKYYKGIRETPFAPFVKLADRLANITYSFSYKGSINTHMQNVYITEFPHFLDAINAKKEDQRFFLPEAMIERIKKLLNKR